MHLNMFYVILMQLDKYSSCEMDNLTSIYGKNTCSLAPHQLSVLFVSNANVSINVRGCERHEVKKALNTSFMRLL